MVFTINLKKEALRTAIVKMYIGCEITKPYPYHFALLHHNIGQNRVTQEKFVEAIENFNVALENKEFAQSMTGLKTTYYLLNVQLRIETYSHGLSDLEEQVTTYKLPEFVAKCKVLRGLYLENNLSLVKTGLDMLESNEQYFEYTEMCDEISQYFESKGDLALSLEYSKLARKMSKNQTIVGVNQS